MAVIGSLVATLALDSGSFIRDLDRAGRSLDKVGRRIKDVGKNMSTFVSAPIIGFGALALKTAGDFEEGMNRVAAVSGATAPELAKLREEAKRLGASIEFGKFSARDAAEGMGFLAQAGFKTNEIIGAMPATLQLASAAQIDLGQSADIVSNILTGYGKTVEELTTVNDVLVKTFTATNTNLSQLGEAMKFAGPVASAAGVQFEEAAAAIGLMGNAGLQGTLAGTSLRGAMTQILNPTAGAAETMAELGINLTDTSGRMRPLVEVLEELAPHADDAGLFMELFGQRAGPGMAALVAQGSEALAQLTTDLENSGGTAASVAETQMQGFAASMEGLRSSFEALQIAIADSGLLEFAQDLIKRLADFVAFLSEVDPAILKFGAVLAGVVAAVGPLLVVLGGAAVAIGALLTPIGLVVTAIVGAAGLVTAIVAFRKQIGSGFVNAINSVIQAFKSLATDPLAAVQALVSGVTALLGGPLIAAFDQVKESINSTVGLFQDMFDRVVGNSIVPDMVDEIGVQFGRLDRNMVKPAQEAVEETAKEFEKLEDSPAIDMQRVFVDPFSNAMSSIQNTFTNTFEEIFSGGIKSFSDLAGQIKQIFIRLSAEIASAMVIQPVIGGLGGVGGPSGIGGGGAGSLLGGLGGPLIAGGLGAVGGGLIAPMLGLGKTGGTIGGGVGAAAGMALGGPLGALVGGLGGTLLGGGLGKLFGGEESNQAQGISIFRNSVNEFGATGKKFNEELRGAVDTLGGQLQTFLQGIESATGARFRERIQVEVGQRDPSRVRVGAGSISDPGTLRGPTGDPQAALGIALEEIASQFTELSNIQQRVLQRSVQLRGPDIGAILQDVQFAKAVEELRNPLTEAQQEIRAVNQRFQGLKQHARELGLATGLLDRAHREAVRTVHERAREERRVAREQFRAAVQQQRDAIQQQRDAIQQQRVQAANFFSGLLDPLEELQLDLAAGPLGGASPARQFAALQEQFQQTAALARGGDLQAIERLAGAGRAVIEGAAEFGASPAQARAAQEVRSVIRDVVSNIEAEQARVADPPASSRDLRAQTNALLEVEREAIDAINELRQEIRKLRQAA